MAAANARRFGEADACARALAANSDASARTWGQAAHAPLTVGAPRPQDGIVGLVNEETPLWPPRKECCVRSGGNGLRRSGRVARAQGVNIIIALTIWA